MENKALHSMKKQQLLDLIQDLVNGIQKQHDTAKELTDEIKKQCKELDTELSEIQEHKQNINTLVCEISTQHDSAKKFHSEVQKWHEDSSNYISNIEEQKNTAGELIGAMQEQNNTASTCVSEIEKQKNRAGELIDEIQKQHDTDTKFIAEKQEKYIELFQKIEKLLPRATSAGLASSYREAHEKKSTKGYWCGFIISLTVLVIGYFVFFFIFPEITWMTIIIRTIVGIPLIWIAWYCQRTISQTNRIKEEYHHKQRVMSVFNGFSKQIDELTQGNPEENKAKKLELISVIINAIKQNPSEKIDPSETFLDSVKNKRKQTDKNKTSEEAEE